MAEFILSIIIPCYNMEKYITKNIESLDFSLTNVEYVFVDDGSTDKTLSIINSYSHHKNLVIYTKTNSGYGPTISFGIQKARGKYIKILDSDDWFVKESIKKHIEYIKKHSSVDIILTNVRDYYGDSKTKYIGGGLFNLSCWQKYDNKNGYFDFHKNKLKHHCTMHQITVKKDVISPLLSENKLPKKVVFTDIIYVILCFFSARTLCYQKIYLYCYRLGRKGQSVEFTIDNDKVNAYINCYKTVLGFVNNFLNKKIDKNHVSNIHTQNVVTLFCNFINSMVVRFYLYLIKSNQPKSTKLLKLNDHLHLIFSILNGCIDKTNLYIVTNTYYFKFLSNFSKRKFVPNNRYIVFMYYKLPHYLNVMIKLVLSLKFNLIFKYIIRFILFVLPIN